MEPVVAEVEGTLVEVEGTLVEVEGNLVEVEGNLAGVEDNPRRIRSVSCTSVICDTSVIGDNYSLFLQKLNCYINLLQGSCANYMHANTITNTL